MHGVPNASYMTAGDGFRSIQVVKQEVIRYLLNNYMNMIRCYKCRGHG
jgi:hypothetical protein